MERLKTYWTIDNTGYVFEIYDQNYSTDNMRYEIGNYFATQDQAEEMAKKLKAVLKGADVIEMPNEKEMLEARPTFPMFDDDKFAKEAAEEYCANNGLPAGACASQISHGHNCMYEGFLAGVNWLKSKIIK